MSQADDSRVHRRLTLNSLSNVARFALLMVIAFFLTPFIVRTLGDSVYGFWVLLMSFLGYASILELGVQPAVVKMVGQYRAVGEYDRLRELISSAFVFFVSVGAIVFVLCVTVLPTVVDRYVDGLQEAQLSRSLYILIAFDATIMYLSYLSTGILYGCQRYHLRNLFDLAGWALNVILIVRFLESGGLVALLAAKIAMDTLVLLLTVGSIPRVFPELRIDLRAVSLQSFRELMSFGGRVFLSATTTRLAYHAQPIIISTSLNSAAAAFFAIPVKLVDYVRQVSWTLTAAFMPMFSQLESQSDKELLKKVYLDYSRYIFTILLPFPLLLYVYGPDFIALWIGQDYADAGRVPLYFLTTAVLIESFQPLMWRFFIGVGHLNILVAVSAIVSALTVVGSIVLVRVMGISGVALSLLLGAVVAQSSYLVHASRYLDMSWAAVIAHVNLRPLAAGAIACAVALGAASQFGKASYAAMAAGSVITLSVHAGLSVTVAITGRERDALRTKISGMISGH